MQIVFLCGALEPGRDGVGDYVRQLGVELRRQGHQATGISLNDQYVREEVSTIQLVGDDEFSVFRLPASWPGRRRFRRAKEWIAACNPDWVSLQFVPYSFDTKGLPLLLNRQISGLTKGRKVHLMMHEAWVGMEPGTGLKRRIMAGLQKAVIGYLIKGLYASVIHTHLPIYRARIQRLGWSVLPLPLFSNIPVVEKLISEPQAQIFRIGIFSQSSSDGPFIDFLNTLLEQLCQTNCACEVLLMGGEPTKMHQLKTVLENIAGVRAQVRYTGFLEPAQLSAALRTCHLGLTPVPQHGLGKSGTVAAFLAHGIPVAAPVAQYQNDEHNMGFFNPDICSSILKNADIYQIAAVQSSLSSASKAIQVSTVASTFLADLEATKKHTC